LARCVAPARCDHDPREIVPSSRTEDPSTNNSHVLTALITLRVMFPKKPCTVIARTIESLSADVCHCFARSSVDVRGNSAPTVQSTGTRMLPFGHLHGDVPLPEPITGTRPSPSCTIHIDTQPPAKHDALDRRQMATVAGTPHCFLRSSGTPTRRHRQARALGVRFAKARVFNSQTAIPGLPSAI